MGSGIQSLSDIESIIATRLAESAAITAVGQSPLEQPSQGPEPKEAEKKKPKVACEELMGRSLAERIVTQETIRADRREFDSNASLHSSYDIVTRYETKIVITERRIRVETLTDIYTGKFVRPDLSGIGPERSKITWASLALIICLTIEAAMPFDRLQKALYSGLGIFSTSSLCRYFQLAAAKLAPIYLWLAAELAAKALVLSGDDSYTRCIEMEISAIKDFHDKNEELDPLVKLISDKLGRFFPYKNDPEKIKSGIYISHVHGRADQEDPCSTIYIYRTHFGHYGNLLSRLLALRPDGAPKVIVQGDLSPSNFPEPLIFLKWVARFVGCAAHARRPFKRYEDDDPGLCDRMLELFALVTATEKFIFAFQKPEVEIVKLRQKLEVPIWDEIRNLSQSVLDAEKRKLAKGLLHRLWPKKAPLYKGCRYIVKNFPELTAYLEDAKIDYTNNRSERLLRGEKILLLASKFRMSEVGRVSLDILRSLVMTAKAAEVSPKAYLTWVLAQKEKDIKKEPQEYTPLAYRALMLAASTPQANAS